MILPELRMDDSSVLAVIPRSQIMSLRQCPGCLRDYEAGRLNYEWQTWWSFVTPAQKRCKKHQDERETAASRESMVKRRLLKQQQQVTILLRANETLDESLTIEHPPTAAMLREMADRLEHKSLDAEYEIVSS